LHRRTPGTTTILIDKFDAGRFQSTANGQIVGRRHGYPVFCKFGAPNGCYTQ
jgi:hypothetical protein